MAEAEPHWEWLLAFFSAKLWDFWVIDKLK